MKPPDMKKGGPRANGNRPSDDLQAAHDKANGTVPNQLPLVIAATVFEPFLGLKTALVVLDEPCSRCGIHHSHRCAWPHPALLGRRGRCGGAYELALHRPVKASRRGRRAVRAVA